MADLSDDVSTCMHGPDDVKRVWESSDFIWSPTTRNQQPLIVIDTHLCIRQV